MPKRIDWESIRQLEEERDEIFDGSGRILIGKMRIPACSLPGNKGYSRLREIRAEIRRLKKGEERGDE